MTLNGHFALKSISASATNGLASPTSDKTVRKFAEIYPYTVSDKNVSQGTWPYKVYADIRGGSLGKGRQIRVWSLKMAIFASFVHCLPNILLTYMATRQLARDTNADDLGDISRSLDLFHIKLLMNGA